ncbi:hypothetical protein E3N88_30816 [Mikania micrantha]|uniref:Uncharacterized protein n=1 Tax=Mikania micrantha TaxID=192012 RepID=A0A5N6MNH0_9ASTR|nr:hypothetical protein E3N88_30816 [Mikania micrantha]
MRSRWRGRGIISWLRNCRELDTLNMSVPKLDMHLPRDQILQPIPTSRQLLAGMSEPLTELELLLHLCLPRHEQEAARLCIRAQDADVAHPDAAPPRHVVGAAAGDPVGAGAGAGAGSGAEAGVGAATGAWARRLFILAKSKTLHDDVQKM